MPCKNSFIRLFKNKANLITDKKNYLPIVSILVKSLLSKLRLKLNASLTFALPMGQSNFCISAICLVTQQ